MLIFQLIILFMSLFNTTTFDYLFSSLLPPPDNLRARSLPQGNSWSVLPRRRLEMPFGLVGLNVLSKTEKVK
jgi:hypothetical protein